MPSTFRSSPRLARRLAATAMLCVVFAGPALSAQTFDATNLQEPKLLAATWLVYGGDDPAFARTDFDDSQWMIFDSTKDLRALFPKSHPEVVWYRLRVKVLPRQTDFALEENSLSSAFEVFTNGVMLMKLGQVSPFVPYTSSASLVENIPDSQMADGTVLIAVRAHIAPDD